MFENELFKSPFPLLNIALDLSPKATLEILQKKSAGVSSLRELIDEKTYSKLRPFVRVNPINDYIITRAEDLVVSNTNREKANIMIQELKKRSALKLKTLEEMTKSVGHRLQINRDF
jgi:hypothetical protein